MEVLPKRSKALPEGLKVSSSRLHVITPELLRLLRLTKLSRGTYFPLKQDHTRESHLRGATYIQPEIFDHKSY